MSEHEYDHWRAESSWASRAGGPLVLEVDVSPAAWLLPLLSPDTFEVGMTVPEGFECYARIFFPFTVTHTDGIGGFASKDVSWREVARRNGKVAHALMEEETVSQGANGTSDDYQVGYGLSQGQLDVLVPLLARHSASTAGWFLLWDGFGDLNEQVFTDVTRVRHPIRDYYLFSGPLSAYDLFPDAPSYWWPDDRSWCYSTDVDFAWGYIAGARACVTEILSAPVLDAIATKPDNPARFGMDVINRPPTTPPPPAPPID